MSNYYQLEANEKFIIKGTDFRADGFSSSIKELLLTSQNLVIVWDGKKRADSIASAFKDIGDVYKQVLSLGLLKNGDSVEIYSLNEIKMVDSEPEIFLNESNGTPSLDVYFTNGLSLSITRFEDGWSDRKNNQKIRNALIPWYNSLISVTKGEQIGKEFIPIGNHHSDIVDTGNNVLSKLLKGSKDALDSSLLNRDAEKQTVSVRVTKKCTGCGAPITGYEGKSTDCSYCDTTNYL